MQKEFEGGKSLAVDFYQKIKQAGDNLLDSVNPETLKRVVPIYGGLTRQLQVYYCPADLEVPSRIYTHDRGTFFDFVPPAQFYAGGSRARNKFTIEYVNGVRYVVVHHPMSAATAVVDPMDGSQAYSGVALSVNDYNFLPGASASMQGTFTDAAYEVDCTLPVPIDISQCLFGIAILPMYVDSAALLSTGSVEVQLIDESGSYYDMVSSTDSVGNQIRDGQNFLRFSLQRATQSGGPDATNITRYKIRVPMKAGNSQTVIFGRFTVQSTAFFELEYYSRWMFQDAATQGWKETPSRSTDLILVDRDARGILHYEAAILIYNSAKVSNPGQLKNFTEQLQRKYDQYWRQHPSSAEPLIGSVMPDIAYQSLPYNGSYGSYLPEDLGASAGGVQFSSGGIVYFADAETPVGAFDGVNRTFTLQHAPDPQASLVIYLNGVMLVNGNQYTVSGKVITFASAPGALLAGLPFLASYRYTLP